MADSEIDPSGTTQQFRAFVQRAQPEPVDPPRSAAPWIVAAVVVVLVIVAAVAWFAFRG